MRRQHIAALMMFILISCNPSKQMNSENQLTREQKMEGWKLLFNGRNSKGWHRYGGGSIDSVWKVSEGVLWLDTKNKKAKDIRGDWDIVTDEEFENFHLQLEWKLSEKGNSGIIFYIHEDKKKYNWPWETGPEMQVLDNDGHPDGKFQKHRAGDLYDIIASSSEPVKPVGEWNFAEVKCVDGKLDLYLNGVNIISTVIWDENWRKLVAGSKFKNMPGFSIYKKGRIGLQDHGDDVYYRNIRIRRL